ncbi:MAG: protein-disulfide reductase DsbD family protein, partial [candidate division Zixibacteria bacterium]|nr:protein-disulfide reductase DsbD family protein [candidate division Zixibacteria bacterium]
MVIRRVRSFIGRTLAVTAFLATVGLTAAGQQAQIDMLSGSDPSGRELAEVSVVLAVSSTAAGRTYAAAAVVDIAEEWHINSAKPYQDFLIPASLAFDTVPGITPHSVAYPEGSEAVLGGERMSVYDGRVVVRFEVSIDQDVPPGEVVLPVRFTYQPCNDRECRAPQTAEANLPIKVGDEGQSLHADIFAAAPYTGAEEQSSVPAVESDLQRLIDNYGFWGYILALGIAFITGLLLSFSPCTYPMIPITVSVFAGQQRSLGRGFVLSLFYVGSMAVMYGIMGLIVSLVGGVFGAWLASPPVVIAIAVVFVAFALSMFGLY